MTREEAIKVLEAEKKFLFHGSLSDRHYEPAFDMAIEALQEQKTGKWLEKNCVYSKESHIEDWQSCCCSVCGHYDTRPYMYYFDEPNYCSYCGTRMVGEEE